MERKRIGIFVSVYSNFEAFKNCMESLLDTYFSNHDVAIFVGFNGLYKEAEEYIKIAHKTVVENTPVRFHTFVPNANIGKGKLINLMASYCKNLDFLVSVDGDVQFSDPDWLNKFLEAYYLAKEKNIKIGALAPMIQLHNVHVFGQGHDIVHELDENLHFVHRDDNVTAGPLFFIPIDVWNVIGGYRYQGQRGPYGPDDATLCYDAKQHEYLVGFIPEISICHPFEENKDYINWKWDACHGKEPKMKGFYDD